MVVSTTLTNNEPNPRVNTYRVGMNVRLFVPKSYGMFQANGLIGTIVGISGNDFTLNFNSSLFDAFTVPAGTAENPASLAPFGSRNLEYDNTTSDVPFHSLNNIGN